MSSSKGSSSSTFTPPPEVVEAYKEALGYGRAAMGQQYQPYTGEITAPLTPTQESGIYNVNRAVGTAIPYFGQATAMTANAANTPITPQQFSQGALEQYMSPYTKYVADATFANLREQQKQEQEALQSGAIRAGAFGGDRAGIAAANMARQQDIATAQAMSNIYNQGYGQAAGLFGQQQGVNYAADVANAARQMQGAQQLAGLGTGLQGSVLQGAQAQLAAGAQQQAVQQAINSGYYNQYLGAQAYPYQQAQFFANLATGVGGQMGGTTTGTPAQPSPAGSIFGALGALGSIFSASDKRVKENIKPIGKTNDGQTIYRYNFKGDPTTQIGLIAQEVEKKHPEAVRTFNGVKAVDYKEATDDSVHSMGGVVPARSNSTRYALKDGGTKPDENYLADEVARLEKFSQASNKAANVAPGSYTANDGTQMRGRFVQSGPYLDVGGGVSIPVRDAMLMFDASYGKVPNTPMKPNIGVRAGLQIPFEHGGLVPSMRHNFAAGGPSLSDEEDPMIPYKAGVPSKVLQIPKLAKIGGSKPNFGGEPPKSPSGPSEKDFKGAAEGLGKAWNKFNTPDAKVSGFENLGKDFEDMLPASAFSAAFAARGGAIGGLRPRFADGEDVPETRDSVYIPDRDRADIIRPSFNPESDAAPVRLASLGDAARRTDAGIPSSEPIREPARDVNVGLVPSMARSNADLPPLFAGKETPEPSQMAVAAKQAADAEPETPEAKPVSVPSMARADTNVPAVTPGLAAAKAPARQAAPLTGSDRDAVIRTIIGESGREPYEGQLGVAQVIRNRQLSGRYGKSAADVVYAPKQFSVWNPGDPAGAMANKVDPNSPLYQRIGNMVDQVWAGEAEDPTKGATHFANVATVMAQRGNLQPWLQGMIDSGNTIKIGAHTFGQADAGAYSPSKEGTPSAGGKTLGDIQASYKGPAAEGKRTQVAAAGESWPGFGVASEGKRSIVESLVGKDLDPIQKRAMFAFFAGMAASPSPWFGQQLGAGMQAASNVYNDSMNKQAEIGIKKEQLGLEEQKIGVQERLAGIQEKTKGLELLKFWQSQFIEVPSDTEKGVYYYRDVTNPSRILTASEYTSEMQKIMKQYGLSPADVGGVSAGAAVKPGLAPEPKPVEAGAPPAGGVVPQPEVKKEAEPVQPTTQPIEPVTPVIPKPTTIPEQRPAPAQKTEEAKAEPVDLAKKYPNVVPEDMPENILDRAKRLRMEAENSRYSRNPNAQAKTADLEAQAKLLEDKAKEIENGDRKVRFTDGRPSDYLPGAVETKITRETQESEAKENVKNNMKLREKMATQEQKSFDGEVTARRIQKLLEGFRGGALADSLNNSKAILMDIGNAIGVPIDDKTISSWVADPAKYDEFVKLATKLSFGFVNEADVGKRMTNLEMTTSAKAQPSPTIQPEASANMIAEILALNQYNKEARRAMAAEMQRVGVNKFNESKFIADYNDKFGPDHFKKIYEGIRKDMGVRGATPTDRNKLIPGQVYILEPGTYGNRTGSPAKARFKANEREGGNIKTIFDPVE